MWVWQQNKWPNFEYSKSLNGKNECKLEFDTGVFIGLIKAVNDEDKKSFIIDIISNEALKTSEIEGEKLNRDSLQSSIMNFFGINKTPFRKQPAEYGIAEMMTDLYNDYKKQLDNKTLCNWHSMLMNGRRDINIGKYRYLDEPMQIISGRIGDSRVYYEAPPSSQIEEEMKRFIKWFNESSPEGKNPISPLIRASICHLYFEMIHPFEDGNGRIGRALVQKIIAQHFDYPVFIALSNTINNRKKEYYNAFEIHNNSLLIDRWIDFFSSIILESIQYTSKEIDIVNNILQDKELSEKIVQVFKLFRDAIDQGQLANSVFSTRRLKTVAEVLKSGDTLKEAFEYEVIGRYTKDEQKLLMELLKDVFDSSHYLTKKWTLGMDHPVPTVPTAPIVPKVPDGNGVYSSGTTAPPVLS